jgi:MAF protein
MERKLVLASSSPYRRQLLMQLVPSFHSEDPAIDESREVGETATALVKRLALAKAQRLAPAFANALIIGADQVASLEGDILGKPGTFTRAREQLRRCSGRSLTFYTGLCLLDTSTDDFDLACETYQVEFRVLSDREIDTYLRREKPFDCAGSFKSEGLGITLFERLEGDDPNALIGLPLIRLIAMLESEGIDLLNPE